MIRAIFFDFYGVWAPDKLAEYLSSAQQLDPETNQLLNQNVAEYYKGRISIENLADMLSYRLGRPEITAQNLSMFESNLSPALADFMRNLHSHFVKLGVLANLGQQEYELLKSFNEHNQLLEIITGPYVQQTEAPLLSQEVFAKALQAIGEPPRSCLVVTGHPDYQQYAESLGITAVAFEGFPKLRQTLDDILLKDAPGA